MRPLIPLDPGRVVPDCPLRSQRDGVILCQDSPNVASAGGGKVHPGTDRLEPARVRPVHAAQELQGDVHRLGTVGACQTLCRDRTAGRSLNVQNVSATR